MSSKNLPEIDVHTREQKFLHSKHVHQFFFNIVSHFYIDIFGCNKRLITNYLFLSHINM